MQTKYFTKEYYRNLCEKIKENPSGYQTKQFDINSTKKDFFMQAGSSDNGTALTVTHSRQISPIARPRQLNRSPWPCTRRRCSRAGYVKPK